MIQKVEKSHNFWIIYNPDTRQSLAASGIKLASIVGYTYEYVSEEYAIRELNRLMRHYRDKYQGFTVVKCMQATQTVYGVEPCQEKN